MTAKTTVGDYEIVDGGNMGEEWVKVYSASKLTTPRKINDVLFDGTKDIEVIGNKGDKGDAGASITSVLLDDSGDLHVAINNESSVVGNVNTAQTNIYNNTVEVSNSVLNMKNSAASSATSASASAASAASSATSASASATSADGSARYAKDAADIVLSSSSTIAINNLIASCYDTEDNTWYDLLIANITVTANGGDITMSQITDFPIDILARDTTYENGEFLFTNLLPKGYYIYCEVGGTTASVAPYYNPEEVWNTVTDGTAIFNICKFQSHESVDAKKVGNSASKIPVYSDAGHLILPSGLELW